MTEITTRYIYPPIPIRCFDWMAYRDPEGLVGTGSTEQDAIDQLLGMEESTNNPESACG